MRTLLAELERALRRRITIVLVLVALGLTMVVGVTALIVNDSDAERARKYDRQRAQAIEDCVNDPYRFAPIPEIVELEPGAPGGPVATVVPEDATPFQELTEEERVEQCTRDVESWLTEEGPFRLTSLWNPDDEDAILLLPATLLLLCGLGAGASMIGAEWKANTVTTVLCWEPRRVRLLAARMGASFLAAMVIAILLQLAFSAAFVPTAMIKGTTAGLDSAWWRDYLQAVVRTGALTGGAATLGVALGSVARSTAGGMGAVMLWVAVGEQILGALRPKLVEWLIAPNLAVLTIGEDIEEADFVVTVADAATRLSIYLAIVVAISLVLFQRRDVAG